MQSELERLHKTVSRVAGDICIALTIHRISGGKATIRRWIAELKLAIEALEKFL